MSETIIPHPAIQVPTALYVVTVVVLGLGRKRSRKLLTASVAGSRLCFDSFLAVGCHSQNLVDDDMEIKKLF